MEIDELAAWRGHGAAPDKMLTTATRNQGFDMNSAIPVLIVDDYPTMRQTIADVMRKFGFGNISFAEDGLMAWEMIQSHRYELLLVDWSMPRMTGLELLQRIRSSQEDFASVPILAITAEAEQRYIIEAVKHGVTDYIVKPFTPTTLERKLKRILSRRRS